MTPRKVGGSKSPRGESPPRSQGRHPGNRGKRRMQRWDVHARQGLAPRKAGEVSHCRGEMRSKKEL